MHFLDIHYSDGNWIRFMINEKSFQLTKETDALTDLTHFKELSLGEKYSQRISRSPILSIYCTLLLTLELLIIDTLIVDRTN